MISRESLNRLRTLLSVDDIIGAIGDYLASVGELDHTYIMFASDHGYNLGQFGIPSHKTQVSFAFPSSDPMLNPQRLLNCLTFGQVYEHVVRVPFVVAGPGIAPGSRTEQMSSFADVTPTILDLAGYKASAGDGYSELMDGEYLICPLLLRTLDPHPDWTASDRITHTCTL